MNLIDLFLLDITYRDLKRKTYRGELIVTKYRLIFAKRSPDPTQV
jgi:hypothetical protein